MAIPKVYRPEVTSKVYRVEALSCGVLAPEELKEMLWELLGEVFMDLTIALPKEKLKGKRNYIRIGDGHGHLHHSLLDGLLYLALRPYQPWWEAKYPPKYTEAVRRAFKDLVFGVMAARKELSEV